MEPLEPLLRFRREMPEWVQRWYLARDAEDDRLFPEQVEGIRSLHFNNGYPLGDAKDIYNPSGYEREMRVVATIPMTDAEYWVQPEEYPLGT